jgi:hypothetical protein
MDGAKGKEAQLCEGFFFFFFFFLSELSAALQSTPIFHCSKR